MEEEKQYRQRMDTRKIFNDFICAIIAIIILIAGFYAILCQNYYFENKGGVIFKYNAISGHVDYCYISENKWERLGHE